MEKDYILEIGIDSLERLYIKPEKAQFTLIYRTATEVHWDMAGSFLYSPKPRERSYLEWYKHILDVVKTELNCQLFITTSTLWTNVPKDLQQHIFTIDKPIFHELPRRGL